MLRASEEDRNLVPGSRKLLIGSTVDLSVDNYNIQGLLIVLRYLLFPTYDRLQGF